MGYREEIEDFRAGRLASTPGYELVEVVSLLNEEDMPPIEYEDNLLIKSRAAGMTVALAEAMAEKPKERKPDEPVEKSVERKPEEPRKPCEPGCTEHHVHVR